MKACIFCKKELGKHSVNYKGTKICYSCAFNISGCYLGLGEQDKQMLSESVNEQIFPRNICSQLDRYVIGQERAKKILSVAAYSHYVRTSGIVKNVKKSNVMLLGPSGCGKTYLIQCLSQILNVPFVTASATDLTEAGYVGNDVDSIIQRLYMVSGNDVEATEKGIVFIDEIDKLCVREQNKAVGTTGVQQRLLTLLEGEDISIKTDKVTIGVSPTENVVINTRNILFICGGAFPDIKQIVEERLGKGERTSIGFHSEIERQGNIANAYMAVTDDDLKKFGMIPEFVGRFPVIVGMEELTQEAMRRILVEPKENLISQYQELFRFSGMTLDFEEDALDEIAHKAMEKCTGARALNSIVAELLDEILFMVAGSNDIQRIVINKRYVQNGDIQLICNGRHKYCSTKSA